MTTSDQKKAALAAFVIMAFIAYSAVMRGNDSHPVVAPNTAQASPSVPAAPSPTASTPVASQAAGYKDGTYTGPVADAFYGNIQVQATIQNGKITGVTFLQYPDDRPNSVAINRQAMPYLKQEAIQAQSAHVDGISGATDTSQAFVQSLSAALSQAG